MPPLSVFLQRAPERTDEHRRRAKSALARARLSWRAAILAVRARKNESLAMKKILPSVAIAALLMACGGCWSSSPRALFFEPGAGSHWNLGAGARRIAVGGHRRVVVPGGRRISAGGSLRDSARLWMGWCGCLRTLNRSSRCCAPYPRSPGFRIAILWFGVGNTSPIFLIFISSVFPMWCKTTAGVHAIERRYLRAAQNFGVSR